MTSKKVINIILITTLIYLSCNVFIFKEPIFLFLIYIVLFEKRFYSFLISTIIFTMIKPELILKNFILFILYELILNVIISKENINNKSKYRVFLLTFFLYLVLINIFEPIVYNFNRILNSIYLYMFVFLSYKISLILKK